METCVEFLLFLLDLIFNILARLHFYFYKCKYTFNNTTSSIIRYVAEKCSFSTVAFTVVLVLWI